MEMSTSFPLADERSADDAGAFLSGVLAKRGRLANFYRMIAHSPAIAQPLSELVWSLWEQSTIGRASVELIILRVGQVTGSEYEWTAHVPLARAAGVSERQIEALERGADPGSDDAFDAVERLILSVTDACIEGSVLPSAAVAELRDAVGTAGVIEVMTTAGLYRAVSVMLQTLEVSHDEQSPGGGEYRS